LKRVRCQQSKKPPQGGFFVDRPPALGVAALCLKSRFNGSLSLSRFFLEIEMAVIEAASPHVMNTYGRVPIALSHGRGVRVWDVNGKEYLDGLAGIAVNTLGHGHPKLVPALQDQIAKLIHSSNYYHVPGQEQLAAKLVEVSGMTNVFFCNSGLEANEAAIKLARKYGHDRGIARPVIVVYEKAFHGRSIATLSATGNAKVQQGFEPLVEGFIRVPLNDIAALKRATEGNPDVVAVFFETIQGEGGINQMRVDYLQQVRRLCDERQWLLMIDEVQCGMGRTGKWFAHQWAGIQADVVPLAKGLGSGVPIGAVIAGPKAANVFQPGNHGTTFGGNPLAMRAGVETMRIMEEDHLLENAARVGAHLKEALARELGGLKGVTEVRGQGLMLGVELDRPCGVLVQRAAEAGLLLSVTADTVVRLLPALILTEAEADEIVARLVPLVKAFLAQ
jgi:acetylornithine/N-succinyldiaminopimelate aminotransferase